MRKYCNIIDVDTGLVNVGLGTNAAFYKSIGMVQRDVAQSDVDGKWYLASKCPHRSPEELLAEAKQAKYNEANEEAHRYLESGEALFGFEKDGALYHVEATDGNIGKIGLKATSLLIKGDVETTFPWNTKEDINIEINGLEGEFIANGLGSVQDEVWVVKFPYFLKLIKDATTVEEVNSIIIDYSQE